VIDDFSKKDSESFTCATFGLRKVHQGSAVYRVSLIVSRGFVEKVLNTEKEGRNMHFSKLVNEFISPEEQEKLNVWFEEVKERHGENQVVDQDGLRSLQESIKGWSIMRGLSDSEPLKQLVHSLIEDEKDDFGEIPQFVWDIRDRIIEEWKEEIPDLADNSFVQLTLVGKDGFVHPHYDPSPDGFVTCRANVFFSTWDGDHIYINKKLFPIQERDLICFAASIYKHKTEPSQCEKRAFCSFGFLIPYETFGIDHDDPKVRMSRRIWKHFVDLEGSNYVN